MIDGVIINKLERFEDSRGWLTEIYREDELKHKPAMSYISMTKPGVVRGPHEHLAQTDMFAFLGPGKFCLHLWDNRKKSKTFGEKMEIEGGEDKPIMAIVPPGVVHGYKCISKISGWAINFPDALYAGKNRQEKVDEVRWEKDQKSPFKMG